MNTSNKQMDKIIDNERKKPTFSDHNINSYKTNLPIDPRNKELIDILNVFIDLIKGRSIEKYNHISFS